jgi:hypothetical protein
MVRRRFPHNISNAIYNDEVITDPREITPERLTAVLRRGEARESAEVIDVFPILSRELQYSTVHRLEVRYRDGRPGLSLPRTLFLKLCGTQEAACPADACRAEVDFYKTAAGEIGCPPLVRVFDAAYSAESGRSHLLLEDLTSTHSQHDQHTAPTAEMSRLAVRTMAEVHGRMWNSPRLGNGIGTVFDRVWLEGFVADLNESVTEFITSDPVGLTAEQTAAYRMMLDAAPRIWGRLTDVRGLTVTHGDAHWWNFLYPNDPAVDSVRMFDWQLWHIDLGARDLAFLLAMGGFAEPRPELEDDLLGVYHETLLESGVTGYSREMLNDDYRWSAIRNLNLPVIFRSQGKHPTTWQTALQRSFDAYKRLDCASLIA